MVDQHPQATAASPAGPPAAPVAAPAGPPAAPVADLRAQLPGLEPDRRVDDWGRSERLESLLHDSLLSFLYQRWLRVEVEGVAHVPPAGGVLLVANRAGALPLDSLMLSRALRQEHPARRSVHVASQRGWDDVPGIGMVATKLGLVPAHPQNLHRLLFDEGQVVLVFPEGAEGSRKPLAARYHLASFGDGDFVHVARTAGVPIVPVAILGTAEAAPVLLRLDRVARLPGLPHLPLTPPLPLPAKVRIRFLAPRPAADPRAPGTGGPTPAEAAEAAADIRSELQDALGDLVGRRRSVWLG